MMKFWRLLIGMVFLVVVAGCASSSSSSSDRDYRSSDRGSFRGSYYEVNKGDTLYYIAYITDRNVNNLIRFNELKPPYTLRIGQRIKLWHPAYKEATQTPAPAPATVKPVVVAKVPTPNPNPSPQPVTQGNTQNSTVVEKSASSKLEQSPTKEYVGTEQNVNKVASSGSPANKAVSSWKWPTKGRVVNKFSSGDQGNKGIDIVGQRGQPVLSTASGSVVYSGSALRGYGNLIIVKHNNDYLSAYAHNDKLLVKEGQTVSTGQRIATMGSSGTSSVMLHFEIRYQGKSVNPERYLP